jgi:hypothetical protein
MKKQNQWLFEAPFTADAMFESNVPMATLVCWA